MFSFLYTHDAQARSYRLNLDVQFVRSTMQLRSSETDGEKGWRASPGQGADREHPGTATSHDPVPRTRSLRVCLWVFSTLMGGNN